MITRLLKILEILGKYSSAFLLGPRGTGKTYLARAFLATQEHSLTFDLLAVEQFRLFLERPARFSQEIEAALRPTGVLTVFVDEIQKLPSLLDEVHRLLSLYPKRLRFLLSGSSARKLRRGGANLLAGRAISLALYPISWMEAPYALERALRVGTLPMVFDPDLDIERSLKAYVDTYLKEEIMQESLVRRLESFVRFLEIAAQMNGELVNFTALGKHCGVSTKTAQEYYRILEDTLIVHRLSAWSHSVRKQLSQAPRFYFFDSGILNAIRGELSSEVKLNSYRGGKLFETTVINEFIRINAYLETGWRFAYWRTATGIEVDLILYRGSYKDPIAFEIKATPTPSAADCKGLLKFHKENPRARLFCLCTAERAFKEGSIQFLPWVDGVKGVGRY